MRLIMMGTGPFAVPTLQALASSEHELIRVVTRPPRGRSKVGDNPMHNAAQELNLPIWMPPTVNSPEAVDQLREWGSDLLVVCDYGEILKPETLATARLGGINLHGSLLPKYRGAAPVQWAILNGDRETGVSVIQMTPRLDAGPCLAQAATPIDPEETAAELEKRLAKIGAGSACQVVDQLQAGTVEAVVQDPTQASKAPRLQKHHGQVDWKTSCQAIKNQVRALIPWPRAFTFWRRAAEAVMRLNIDLVREYSGEIDVAASPGTILMANKSFVVRTGDGALEVLEVQPAGKRRMSADEFLRGNRLQVGDSLGEAGTGAVS